MEQVPHGGVEVKIGIRSRKVSFGKVLFGMVNNEKKIKLNLPSGSEAEIKPQQRRWLQANTTGEVSFELGFTLGGPIAYNIKEVNHEYNSLLEYSGNIGV